MDRTEIDALLAAIRERGERDAIEQYEGVADDGFEIARALLQVLGRRFGLGFVLEVQAEVLGRAEQFSRDDDPLRRSDAVEIMQVAQAGYFLDLIDELAERAPSGRA